MSVTLPNLTCTTVAMTPPEAITFTVTAPPSVFYARDVLGLPGYIGKHRKATS